MDVDGVNHQRPDGKTREDTNDRRNRSRTEKHGEADRVNGIAEDVREESSSAALQMQQQSNQRSAAAVCWERFLHVRSIKVLLVENDDSTRHVVTALLRNCSYEVVDAANGIQAMKILEDVNNHIDIVLTEVVMPYLSGVGLLHKILSHKTRHNIPVIMMSSHDSMGLVFKCLSKGAADFLVKPIRKNELKNLWQHVWRRCHSSSGSGSESGTQTHKSVKSKNAERPDKISRSNDDKENGHVGFNVSQGSSDGNGTQESSWTKVGVEVDSPRAVSPCDRVDSTCAQVIPSSAPGPSENDPQEQEEPFDVTIDRDMEISVDRNNDQEHEPKDEDPRTTDGNARQLERICSKSKTKVRKGTLDLNRESPSSRDCEVPNTHCKAVVETNEDAVNTCEDIMYMEHGPKRHRGVKDSSTIVKDELNVLRPSEYSAFSRYNPGANANKPCSGNVGSRCNNHDITNHYSNVGSNNIVIVDMSSTSEKAAAAATSSVQARRASPPPFLHSDYNNVNMKKLPHCGSSSGEGNTVNGSVSGSNHECNAPNGSTPVINAGGVNMESENSGGSGNRTDDNQMSQREAALTKFRQKRKERCFRKKVRYQSRKRLAEQRPRVRGQFVRKKAEEENEDESKAPTGQLTP